MIPTPRLAGLAALGVPLVVLALIEPRAIAIAAVYDAVLVLAAGLDLVSTARASRLEVRRVAPERWVQGRAATVRLRVRNPTARRMRLRVKDLAPPSFALDRDEVRVELAARASGETAYVATPRERGAHRFLALALRSRGPFGLVERQRVVPAEAAVRVFPDLVELGAREATLTTTAAALGRRPASLHGEGREFHQLREYVPGDDVRALDWKAFAHRGRPTVREFRMERNQRVLMLLDAGRMMTTRVADRLRFDWAVQAAGRLARAALAVGDRVGVAAYSRSVKASLPPARTPGHLGRIAELLADVAPDLEEPDLGAALLHVLRRNPRRMLVVLFTELADPRAAAMTLRHVAHLGSRHLMLVVTLADADLEAARDVALDRPIDAFRRVAADELWQDYLTTQRALAAHGASIVRARAGALAAETVERYVEIKRRGRL